MPITVPNGLNAQIDIHKYGRAIGVRPGGGSGDPFLPITTSCQISGTTDYNGVVTLDQDSASSAPGATMASSVWVVNGVDSGATGPVGSTYDKTQSDVAFSIQVKQTWTLADYSDTRAWSNRIEVEAKPLAPDAPTNNMWALAPK